MTELLFIRYKFYLNNSHLFFPAARLFSEPYNRFPNYLVPLTQQSMDHGADADASLFLCPLQTQLSAHDSISHRQICRDIIRFRLIFYPFFHCILLGVCETPQPS